MQEMHGEESIPYGSRQNFRMDHTEILTRSGSRLKSQLKNIPLTWPQKPASLAPEMPLPPTNFYGAGS